MKVVSIEEYRYRIKWFKHVNIEEPSYVIARILKCVPPDNIRYIKWRKAYVRDKETLDQVYNILTYGGYRVNIAKRPHGKWLYMVIDKYTFAERTGDSVYAYIRDFSMCLYDLITLFLDEFTTNIVTWSKKIAISSSKIQSELGVPKTEVGILVKYLESHGYLKVLEKRYSYSSGARQYVKYICLLY